MKLSVLREDLLEPLQTVIGVVDRKPTLPILSNVLIKTNPSQLTVTGTDLEVELIGQTALAAAETTPAFSLTLPGKKLADICKSLPDHAPIELYQDKGRVVLTSGKSRFLLATQPAEEFPSIEKQNSQISLQIPQSQLLHALKNTYFAIAQQDVRSYLNGLLLEIYNNTVKAIATDSHRLAFCAIKTEVSYPHRIQILIPRRAVLELLKLLSPVEECVQLDLGANFFQITSDHFTFTSKLIESRFPDYERAIPRNGTKKIILPRLAFQEALQRAAILTNEKVHGVTLRFSPHTLMVSAHNPHEEIAEEELAIDYSAEAFEMCFNVIYLLEIISCLSDENIALTVSTPESSVLIEGTQENEQSLYVVMPLTL